MLEKVVIMLCHKELSRRLTMNNFSQLVHEWQIFYATIATASATLVGLLFVSMSLNVRLFTGSVNIGLRMLSRQTLLNFLYIIVFALIFLIPRQGPIGLGLPLMCNGFVGLINNVSNLRTLLSNIPPGIFRRAALAHAAMALTAFLILVIVAFLVMVRASTASLYWLVAPMILLLISASHDTWSLLIRVRESSAKNKQRK
jgi:modulator of FtsH protease